MDIHYLIVIPIVVIIFVLQILVFIQSLRKIKAFKEIFPSNCSTYSVKQVTIQSVKQDTIQIEEKTHREADKSIDNPDKIWQKDNTSYDIGNAARAIEVSQIDVNSDSPTTTMNSIMQALNMYLQKNKGAASDFSLMKDVVERYCGAEEDEISVMQPIPLYMGLMGTMIGIITGIAVIAFNGGVEDLTNVSSMMNCVAIAMFASFMGILFTTVISWMSKNAKSSVESRKNIFYSWLQTELLPVLSGNSLTALSLLQTNLMTFNQTFQANIKEFDTALSNVRQVSMSQANALEAINRMDITRVSQANISVLKELQKCMGELGKFNQYLNNVNGYLNAVNSLNTNLNNHLDRTAAIENMGAFFEKEVNQVQTREDYIKEVVESIDHCLEQSFGQMKTSMSDYMDALKTKTEQEMESIRNAYLKQNQDFVDKLNVQQDALCKKAEDMSKAVTELQEGSDVKAELKAIAETSKKNATVLSEIAQSIETRTLNEISDYNGEQVVQPTSISKRRKKFTDTLTVVVKIAAIIAFAMFVYDFVVKYFIG